MKKTTNFNLPYFEHDDVLSAVVEFQRWHAIDNQLYALFSILGEGIISGWEIKKDTGLKFSVSPGSGHLGFVFGETRQQQVLSAFPNSIQYIYAVPRADIYWTKGVNIQISLSKLNYDVNTVHALYLGCITTNLTEITDIGCLDERTELGFINLINELIKGHRHVGGEDNPSPIQLDREVQGFLPPENMGYLDASKITEGILNLSVIPEIDHDTLKNSGVLTHSQIEEYLKTCNCSDVSKLGELALSNFLQLIISLKTIYSNIDESLLNSFIFIPSVSSTSYIDTVNTTADVTTVITGTNSDSVEEHTYKWGSKPQFEGRILNNLSIFGNSLIISSKSDLETVDNFEGLNGWEVVLYSSNNLSSSFTITSTDSYAGGNSGMWRSTANEIKVSLYAKKSILNDDWSSYKYIRLFVRTDSASHGDIYFYIKDSVAGIQNSNTIIIERNTPTVNLNTLQYGWQEIVVNIGDFIRTNIEEIGIYVDTSNGWVPNRDFQILIDNVELIEGNLHKSFGTTRFRYGGPDLVKFTQVSNVFELFGIGSAYSSRYRLALTESELNDDLVVWSTWNTSSTYLTSNSNLYRYIEIEVMLTSSTDFVNSPILHSVEVFYEFNSTESTFSFTSKNDWSNFQSNNIKFSSDGKISIANTDSLGKLFYAGLENGSIDGNGKSLWYLNSNLPMSVSQVVNETQSTLGEVSAIEFNGQNGFFVADTANDRVVEFDHNGNVLFGIFGCSLEHKVTNLNNEDCQYTIDDSEDEIEKVVPSMEIEEFKPLFSIYNNQLGKLYVCFNNYINPDIAKIQMGKMILSSGPHRFYLDKSQYRIAGINYEKEVLWTQVIQSLPTKYANWYNQNIIHFNNVLEIDVSSGAISAISDLLKHESPVVEILSPLPNALCQETVLFKFNFDNFTFDNSEYYTITINGNNYNGDTPEFEVSGLPDGIHEYSVQLYDENGDPIVTDGAYIVSVLTIKDGFTVENISTPHLLVNNCFNNKTIFSKAVHIEYSSINFPILINGQHIQYRIDGGDWVNWYVDGYIDISFETSGIKQLEIRLVDVNGAQILTGSPYVEFSLFIGSNGNVFELLICKGAICDVNDKYISINKTDVYVGNFVYFNINKPIDIQYLPSEISDYSGGSPTLLISKMRNNSTNSCMGGLGKLNELAVFLNSILTSTRESISIDTENESAEVIAQKITQINTAIGDTLNSIDFIPYMLESFNFDGDSVVQIGTDGTLKMSVNNAVFSDKTENALKFLGGARKITPNEIAIADSCNKRAIIVQKTPNTFINKVIWEYNSGYYIPDFKPITVNKTIVINNGSVSTDILTTIVGNKVMFYNNSNSSVSIYSGLISDDAEDVSLSNYGQDFYINNLTPGNYYEFHPTETKDIDWFIYPDLIKGVLKIRENILSPDDKFALIESDLDDNPYGSRVVKIDNFGNIYWEFGRGLISNPKDLYITNDETIYISC